MEERITAVEDKYGRGEDVAVVRGVGEAPVPPEEGSVTGEGEGRASNDLRTAMEVGTEEMTEEEEVADKDNSKEAEGGDIRGGLVGTGSHRDINSGCGSRRHNPHLCLQRHQQAEPTGNDLDGASPLASRGKICVQFLQALDAAIPPPAW